ncbi:MAG: LysM peptidoglycan-binding domain-containing protein [bacterium]|nr:LysM peptidoglycan-binding domain-containing protein [bacterium]
MYKILNKDTGDNKWLDIADLTFKSSFQSFDLKHQQIFDADNNNPNGGYTLNLKNKDTYLLFDNLAKKDQFDSVLSEGDILELNHDFKVLRQNDVNYNKSNEQKQIKIIDENLDLLLGKDSTRVLKKIKTKERKTILLYETENSKIEVVIKENKIKINVKEKTWFFPKTNKTVKITDESISVESEVGTSDYSLTFIPKEKKENYQTVTYRNKATKHVMTDNDDMKSISEIWGIPQDVLEATNAPFNDIAGKKLKIPVDKIRESYSYTVKEGETYNSIAKKLNINKHDLENINKIYTLPAVGKKIKIPIAGNNNKKCKYKVQENDTFESIAEMYNMTVQDLYSANKRLGEIQVLENGMNIIIPQTTFNESYIYKANDTEAIEDIAKEHNVDLTKIKINNSKYSDYTALNTGEKAIIPEYEHVLPVTEDNVQLIPEYVYTVEEGMTLTKLANDLGMSTYQILMANDFLIQKNKNGEFKTDSDNNFIYNPIEAGQKITIPKHKKVIGLKNHDYKSIAQEVGVSESYIIDILLGIEVGRKFLDPSYDLMPYDDKRVRSHNKNMLKKGTLKGTLTIGFGHTGRVFGNVMTKNNWENISITEEEAYLLLAQDIMKAKEEAITYFGEDKFNSAPLSIQEALIDIAFNKGVSGFERSNSTAYLKNDIENAISTNDWTTVAKHTILEPTVDHGLKKRNLYRIILACKDLPDNDRERVMNDMKYYYDKVYKLFSSKNRINTRNEFEKAWKQTLETGWFQENVFNREDIYKYSDTPQRSS